MNEVKKEIFRLRSVVEELQTEVKDLAFENKNFAEFLEGDYSQEGISNIATGELAPQELVRYDQDGEEVFNSCVCQTLRFETCICGEVK